MAGGLAKGNTESVHVLAFAARPGSARKVLNVNEIC